MLWYKLNFAKNYEELYNCPSEELAYGQITANGRRRSAQ